MQSCLIHYNFILNSILGFPGSSASKESACNAGDPRSVARLPTPVFLGFPGGSDGKESACNAGDLGSIPGFGRFPGEGNSYPLWNSMDYIVHGVTKSGTWLSNFHFWFTSLCMTDCRYIHVLTKDPIPFLLWLSKVLFHCLYIPHLLYMFICWQLRLFWCPGYCK